MPVNALGPDGGRTDFSLSGGGRAIWPMILSGQKAKQTRP